MNNQVAALRLLNIAVATVNSNTTHSEREDIFKDLQCGTKASLSPRNWLIPKSIRASCHSSRLRYSGTNPYGQLSQSPRNHLRTGGTLPDCYRRSTLYLGMGSRFPSSVLSPLSFPVCLPQCPNPLPYSYSYTLSAKGHYCNCRA